MDFLLLIGVGIAGIVLGMFLGAQKAGKKEDDKRSEDKDDNIEKVRILAQRNEKITNNDVEKLLGVSDATATRYLEDLEKEGIVRQVHASGPYVYYEKT